MTGSQTRDLHGTLHSSPSPGQQRVRRTEEHGDIISSWLIQLVIFMAVIGFLGYEFLSMATTALTLDGVADRVANVAADAYADDQDLATTHDAAAAYAEDSNVKLIDVRVEDKIVFVTVQDRANTLVAHRIGPLKRFSAPSVTRREKWRP